LPCGIANRGRRQSVFSLPEQFEFNSQAAKRGERCPASAWLQSSKAIQPQRLVNHKEKNTAGEFAPAKLETHRPPLRSLGVVVCAPAAMRLQF
jgi:hypothetical protein